MKDTQKSKVYGAEFVLRDFFARATESNNPMVEVEGIPLTLPPEGKYACIDSIQRYVDSVVKIVGCSPIAVRVRKGNKFAHYCCGEIAIPDANWAMREIVVLHEIAHHLSPGEHHGPGFVAAFIDLLERVMGPEAGLAFRLICAAGGVREGVASTP